MVTNIGDETCWWQRWDFAFKNSAFKVSTNIKPYSATRVFWLHSSHPLCMPRISSLKNNLWILIVSDEWISNRQSQKIHSQKWEKNLVDHILTWTLYSKKLKKSKLQKLRTIFASSLSRVWNSQCIEGAKYVRVL